MLLFPTVDEDYQHFVAEGYNGSINDMHYQALGDIGYVAGVRLMRPSDVNAWLSSEGLPGHEWAGGNSY